MKSLTLSLGSAALMLVAGDLAAQPSSDSSGDGGWSVDRRFTFDRERLLLNGDGAFYAQAGVSATF